MDAETHRSRNRSDVREILSGSSCALCSLWLMFFLNHRGNREHKGDSSLSRSVPTFSFPQNRGKVPATKSETLFNVASDGHFGASAWNSVLPRENPHVPGSVIDQECAASQSSIGINNSAGNCHLFAGIAARITIDLRDAFPGRTGKQQQDSYRKGRRQQKSDT